MRAGSLSSQGHMYKTRLSGYLFILPALLIFIIFLVYPLLYTIYLSLTQWAGFDLSKIEFVGFNNFKLLLPDWIFWKALRNTMIFVFGTTIFLNLFGLALALFLNNGLRITRLVRTLIFIPVLLSPVIVGVMWSRIFDPFGALNQILEKMGVISTPIFWLGDRRIALWSIVGATVWQWVGYDMILYLTGLQQIPVDLYEAAKIDGANNWHLFRFITLPLLKGIATMVILLNLIGGVRIFDIVFVMTRGGPNHNTEVLATHLYEVAFWFNKMGYASVIAVIILVISLLFAYFRNRLMREQS
jgi:raffinose/stachyose/melibiose transport system permease protein